MTIRPLHALLVVLLVLVAILFLRGRALAAERDAERANREKLSSQLVTLRAAVDEANAGVARLEAQGRELKSHVDQATGEARAMQAQAAARVDQVLRSQSVPKDPAGALDWLHVTAAAAASEWEMKR